LLPDVLLLIYVSFKNIDGLEDKAGLPIVSNSYPKSKHVTVHLHGSVRHAWCDNCNLRMPIREYDMGILSHGIGLSCPKCGDKRCPQEPRLRQNEQRSLRTDVKLYNDPRLPEIDHIIKVDIPSLAHDDVIIFAGTSARTVDFQNLVIAFSQAMCQRRESQDDWEGSYPGQCDIGGEYDTDNIFWVGETAPPDNLVNYVDVFIHCECDIFARTASRWRGLC